MKRWTDRDLAIRDEMKQLQELWESTDRKSDVENAAMPDLESEWERLERKMHSVRSVDASGKLKSARLPGAISRRQSLTDYIMRLAAILTLMLAAGYLITQIAYQPELPEAAEHRVVNFSTTGSQLAGVELLDGSKINLSVATDMQLADDYYRNNRTVFLRGHAYFDVVADPLQPFVIYTHSARIAALGTDFSVHAYPDDDRIRVVVMSGIVSITQFGKDETEEVLIRKGERALLDVKTGEIDLSEVTPEHYLGWLDGRIVFEENTLDEVSRELNRWFGIEFQLMDEDLKARQLTAELDSKSLSNVLQVIGSTLDVDYRFEEHRVLIAQR